uniref:DNA2/NAM7 helicase helicase domain-containing protein n=1 Tax=Globodera rostochiensis TaxID=31243 RepID=A0A914I835_GLORO
MSKRRRMDTTEPALSDSTQEMMDTEDSPKKIPIFSLSPLHPVKSLGLQARELPNFSFKPITKPSPSPGNTGKSPTSSGSNVPGYEDLSPEIIVLDDPGPAPSRQHKNSEQTTPPPLATANVRLVSVLDFPDGDKTAESISSLSSSINWEEIVAQAWGLPMSDSPGPGPEEKSENPPHTNPTPSSLTEQVLKSTLISLLDPTGSSNFLSPQENTSAPPPASSQTSANAQPTSKTQGIQRRPSPTPSPPFENKGFSNGSAETLPALPASPGDNDFAIAIDPDIPPPRFNNAWKPDSLLICKKGNKVCAQGTVRQVQLTNPNHLSLQISVNLSETENQFLDLDTVLHLEIPSSQNQLHQRAGCFASLYPAQIARQQTPQGSIFSQILGSSNTHKISPTPELSFASFAKTLVPKPNLGQLDTLDLLFNPTPSIIATEAGPGTGKSQIIIMAIQRNLELGKSVLVTTHSNVALCRLASEILPKLAASSKALLLLSATAKENYMHFFAPLLPNLLVKTIADFSPQSATRGEAATIKKYKRNALQATRLADERTTAEIYLRDIGHEIPLLFATLSMLEDIPSTLRHTESVFIDEAGQAPTSQVIHILTRAPNLSKMLAVGDPKQLEVRTDELPENMRPYAFGSLLSHLLSLQNVPRTKLTISYRGHPILTQCLAASLYEGSITPGVTAEERSTTPSPSPSRSPPLAQQQQQQHQYQQHHHQQHQQQQSESMLGDERRIDGVRHVLTAQGWQRIE